MTGRATARENEGVRTGIFPVLLFLVALVVGFPAHRTSAQLTVRSWLEWRTIETPHFSFHYPAELEAWTRDAASRIEFVDSAVKAVVGFAPAGKTHVVVDDPYEISNGSAWPYLKKPVMNLWAAPPDPREDIGEFSRWSDMLATHEFAHIAHLTRPSRNAFTRRLWSTLPVNLGPVAIRSPRWAIEGYATYVEGRVTRSGRPNGAWRPTFLRQWAFEGKLPTYDQLDASSAYEGGAFAYLAGSAFLEWLVAQHGDSSLVDVWRRLSARQTRSFDDAFTGVFGQSPRTLYARFSAELTLNAHLLAATLGLAGSDTGAIVQRTSWGTGDPAISPDGQRVALVLRSATKPSRVVIWKTASEPDTTRARRDSLLLARDPEDVPARSIYPAPKKPLATLRSAGGSPYESPRFMRDGRVLLWRRTARGDGSLESDLYVWDPSRQSVRRITHGASLRDPDPLPDGRSAVATQCRRGWCDVVRVDLATGATRMVLPGNPSLSFYRPRIAPNGDLGVTSAIVDGRWQLILFTLSGSQTPPMKVIGPSDGANRYDASFFSDDSIVAVSTPAGLPNIEKINVTNGATRTITTVTGAAVAPAYNPRDRSIWFLSLYSGGYDVRRATEPEIRPRVQISIPNPRLAPVLQIRREPLTIFTTTVPSDSRPFGFGPRLFRWIPQPFADADGASVGLGLVSADLIGRSEILVVGAAGDASQWRGAAAEFTWRGWRNALRGRGFVAEQLPSASRSPVPLVAPLDVRMSGGEVGLDRAIQFDSWGYRYRIGGSAAALRGIGDSTPLTSPSTTRALGFVDLSASWTKRGDASGITTTMAASGAGGTSYDRSFSRGMASLGLNVRTPILPSISGSATYGATSANAAPFEQFAIGGGRSPLVGQTVMNQRISMPALPTGISIGTSLLAYRVGVSVAPLSWYLWSGSTSRPGESFDVWNRVIGVEWTQSVAPIALAGTPAARAQIGIGESLDAPFRRKLRAYVSLVLNP